MAEYIKLLHLGAGLRHLVCAMDTGEMAGFLRQPEDVVNRTGRYFQTLLDDKIARSSVLMKNLTTVVYKW